MKSAFLYKGVFLNPKRERIPKNSFPFADHYQNYCKDAAYMQEDLPA